VRLSETLPMHFKILQRANEIDARVTWLTAAGSSKVNFPIPSIHQHPRFKTVATMIRRLTEPKTYTTDLPKYCERSDIENLLNREFSSLARDRVTWIRHYNIEVCGLVWV